MTLGGLVVGGLEGDGLRGRGCERDDAVENMLIVLFFEEVAL